MEPNQPTKRGQHGVIMSNMYPRTENMSYTMVKSIEYPGEWITKNTRTWKSRIQKTLILSLWPMLLLPPTAMCLLKLIRRLRNCESHGMMNSNRVLFRPNFEKITYSSTGAQIVNVDIWPYQTGTFVWYTVNSSMVFTSFLSISILIVINFIRIWSLTESYLDHERGSENKVVDVKTHNFIQYKSLRILVELLYNLSSRARDFQ